MAKSSDPPKPTKLIFNVRPRLLTLLGDQLIRDANLAVFELVKNAYDADATSCTVRLEHLSEGIKARIVVSDDGSGMDDDILRNVWMTIATDFRAEQRDEQRRSPRFGRVALGEKGLGRLSIHKLGHHARLVTRVRRGTEYAINFDWDRLEGAKTLATATVQLTERPPSRFPGVKHGTRLVVTKLRETWTRPMVRRLHRAVNSLCSPFDAPSDFNVKLEVQGHEDWLEGLFTAEDAQSCALYRVKGSFEGATGKFAYEFSAPPGMSRQLRSRNENSGELALEKREGRKNIGVDLSAHKIGCVNFEFLIFDRDPAVLRAVTGDLKGLKSYLDDNGGIRVYRDGIRVYDFGEPGNDWLNLDLRRVNTPTVRISNNQIIGVLNLDARSSRDLREKSNREGFIESPAFEDFRSAVLSILTHVEAEKAKDQRRLKEALGKNTGRNVFSKLLELREALDKKGLLPEMEVKLKAVEREMDLYRDQLLHAAVPGMTLGVMLHGAEKLLLELREAVRRRASSDHIGELVDRLYRAMRPVTNLLKDPTVGKTTAKNLIREALFSVELRLKRHHIDLVDGYSGGADFSIRGSKQMLAASITNLIDNSIHWLESKNPSRKKVFIGITSDLEGGPCIVVADNGPGFGKDQPQDLVAPFYSRRQGGMGLGLYIVDEIMRVNKGHLIFPSSGDVGLPRGIDGAVVALQFPEKQ